jgi:hypothetical protein
MLSAEKSGSDGLPLVTMRLPTNLGTHGHLLAGGNHALAGAPNVFNSIGLDAGTEQCLGHLAPVMTLNLAPIAQFSDEIILEQ